MKILIGILALIAVAIGLVAWATHEKYEGAVTLSRMAIVIGVIDLIITVIFVCVG